MDELKEIQKRLYAELDNFIVNDTYTKGKNAGIRKAIVLIDDMIAEFSNIDSGDFCKLRK